MTPEEAQWFCDLGVAVQRVVDLLEAGLLFESEVYMKRVRSYYPATITIDGDAINLRVKRFSPIETHALEAQMNAYGFSLDGTPVQELKGEEAQRSIQWLQETISSCITLAPGELVVDDDDGSPKDVTTGTDLVLLYGGRTDVIAQLLGIIYGENKIPADTKERYHAALANAVAFTRAEAPVPDAPAAETRVSRRPRSSQRNAQTSLIEADQSVDQ